MKVSSDLDICNFALLKIAQNNLSSLDDDSLQARYCKFVYPQAKQSLLSQYPWSFATKSVRLAEAMGPFPADEVLINYIYKYSLPGDFLRLVRIYSGGREVVPYSDYKPPYAIEGNYLITDVTNCQVKYVADIEDVTLMSPLFIDALIIDVGMRLTKLLVDSGSYTQQLFQEFTIAFTKAKIQDCQQIPLGGIQSWPLLQESEMF